MKEISNAEEYDFSVSWEFGNLQSPQFLENVLIGQLNKPYWNKITTNKKNLGQKVRESVFDYFFSVY